MSVYNPNSGRTGTLDSASSYETAYELSPSEKRSAISTPATMTRSSTTTTQSPPVRHNLTPQPGLECVFHLMPAERPAMLLSSHSRRLTPPSPARDYRLPPPPVPKNGNAFLCTKNGESSKPVYFPAPAPPTPPDSPLPLVPNVVGSTTRSDPVAMLSHPVAKSKGMTGSLSKAKLHIDIPQRPPNADSPRSILTPTASATTPASTAPSASSKKRHSLSAPLGYGGAYMNAFVDLTGPISKKKDKSPIRNAEQDAQASQQANVVNGTMEGRARKIRNPFKRK
jgi:hypothetical protein